jgi:hypothetical protein
VSKTFYFLSRRLLDKILYFPLSGPEPQTIAKKAQPADAAAVRSYCLGVLRDPILAARVNELHVTSELTRIYGTQCAEAEATHVFHPFRELINVLPNAVNLIVFR